MVLKLASVVLFATSIGWTWPDQMGKNCGEIFGGIFVEEIREGTLLWIPSVMIPVAVGDRRDVRLIQVACGEQVHL